ncbi:MAG: hypothetical protein HPY57_14315 [Ignavibacteria bacterium]|nr:hypothetical protein [Ignavibacteria bacterium]
MYRKDKNGAISNLGWAYEESDNVEVENPNEYKNTSKEEFIKQAKSNNLEDKIRTTKNDNVSIISNKYLRTDGDKNKHNDMLDLDSCDKFIMGIINDTFWKNTKIVR